jgi:hypothetical protein
MLSSTHCLETGLSGPRAVDPVEESILEISHQQNIEFITIQHKAVQGYIPQKINLHLIYNFGTPAGYV